MIEQHEIQQKGTGCRYRQVNESIVLFGIGSFNQNCVIEMQSSGEVKKGAMNRRILLFLTALVHLKIIDWRFNSVTVN